MDASRLGLAVSLVLALPTPGQDPPAQDPPAKKLALELRLDWEAVASPRLSPDERQIVFTKSWVDKLEDRERSELWIMAADGGRQRFLCKGSSARWSPDGTRLAYVADGEPKGAQIHVMWVDTREVTQITRLEEGPSDLCWSPDGKRLAFSMIVPDKDDFLKIELPKRPEGAKWAPEPKIITRLAYRRDRSGYRPQGFRHLFVVDANGGTPRQVTAGDFDHGDLEWTADGEKLVFAGLREPDADWQVRESEVYAVDVDRGSVTQLTRRAGPDGGPAPSPDGQWIAYTGHDANQDTYNIADLWLMRTDGSQPKVLASLDREITGLLWSPDSRQLWFTVLSDGARNLHRVTLDGKVEAITAGPHDFDATDCGRSGRVVGTWTSAQEPGDVAVVEAGAKEPKWLTRVNDDLLARVDLAEVEEIRYPSADGLEIQGWIVKPPDFDPQKQYPLILQIHGGPHAMYGPSFSFERQSHAAEGFVVLYTNPRGSVGYGKAFGNAINNAYPGKDYDDLMAGVDAVIARGYVDQRNLFVYGGSGGGVLTCWTVGKTDRFRAAVSMFPVTNWISFVGTTDGPYWYTNFAKLPWEDPTEHWERSPLRLVGNVKTPTLLITGELDLRTPMAQTEEYYQALKLRKIDTAMIRVPDEYHGASGKHVSNQLRRILYVRGWFQKYMVKDEPAAVVEASSTSSK